MEMLVKKYKNGLKHVHFKVPFAQNVTQAFLLNAGSSDEKVHGLAHFLEHMLFNGSVKYPDREELGKLREKLGLQENAWTWCSNTVYYITSTPENSKQAFDILHDRVFAPLLRPKDIEKERGIILEELRMIKDKPYFEINEKMQKWLYKGTGYSHETIGDKEAITKLQKADLESFHKQYYSYSNAILLTYGNKELDWIDEEIEKNEIVGSNSDKAKWAIKSDYKHFTQIKNIDAPIYLYEICAKLPKDEKEIICAMIYDTAMQDGSFSKLAQELLYKESYTKSFDFYSSQFADFLSIGLRLDFDWAKKEKLENLLQNIMMKPFFTPDEFVRAKKILITRLSQKLESGDFVVDPLVVGILSMISLDSELVFADFFKDIEETSFQDFTSFMDGFILRGVSGVVYGS